jgi:hypothetical protein
VLRLTNRLLSTSCMNIVRDTCTGWRQDDDDNKADMVRPIAVAQHDAHAAGTVKRRKVMTAS